MVNWLAGKRIRGTNSERTTSFTPQVGGWVELGRTTLGSAGDTITVSSLANKRYYMVLVNDIASGSAGANLRLGAGSTDSGSNYAYRYSANGGADTTRTSQSGIEFRVLYAGENHFSVAFLSNFSSKEKLGYAFTVDQNTSSASNEPHRQENVFKWTNTSSSLDTITVYNDGGGDFASGSELVVLGWTETDTHTNNFWTELASVELGSASTTLSSGTFTAKKYLWVQMFSTGESSSQSWLRFNSDSGSNYSDRQSANGVADSTRTSVAEIRNLGSYGGTVPFLENYFIINVSAKEKLILGHSVTRNTAGAGNVPHRLEWVGKWANTSSQITNITYNGNTYGAGSIIKVYGSD